MKIESYALALILGLGLGLVAPAFAQEEPKKEEPAKEEAAKPAEEAAPEAAAEAAPAKEEAAKPAAKAAPEAAPAAAPAKELSSCAKSFVPLSDSYKKAYDDMQKWIAQIDTQTAAAGEKVQKLQAQITENETAATKAKLDGDGKKGKELAKENKQLWTDFNAAKKSEAATCSGFAKEAADRVKQNTDVANKALEALKAQTK